MRSALCALGSLTFRSLKWIDLPVSLFSLCLKVGSHVAIPGMPPGVGIRKYKAVSAGGEFFDFLAAFTLLDNGMAGAAIKLAAFFAHEKTFIPFLYACTNHFNHILSYKF